MKHVTFADKNLLVGDDAAEVMLEYAAALSSAGDADTVQINAIGADGDAVVATFLLNTGSPIMAETTHSELPEPDNEDVVQYMRDQLDKRTGPHEVPSQGQETSTAFEEEFGY